MNLDELNPEKLCEFLELIRGGQISDQYTGNRAISDQFTGILFALIGLIHRQPERYPEKGCPGSGDQVGLLDVMGAGNLDQVGRKLRFHYLFNDTIGRLIRFNSNSRIKKIDQQAHIPKTGHVNVLGIDIGGSGVKGAIVDTAKGELVSERERVKTPSKPTREVMTAVLKELIAAYKWSGPVGCGFPGVMFNNVVQTAVNLDPDLVGWDLGKAICDLGASSAGVVNDADAAAIGEIRYGSGGKIDGVVMMLTIGTGIGSALFIDGRLVPNTELGHIEFMGEDAETIVSERARKELDLSWGKWGKRLNDYLNYLEMLFNPSAFILGGGGVKKQEKFADMLKTQAPIHYATLGNLSGIIGAAAQMDSR